MQDGRFHGDDAETILSVLMDNARKEFGDDLNDDEEAVIRLFYTPIANLLADVQNDLSVVLDSAQLEYAEGQALDLLTALIGVRRHPAYKAKGTATFSRASNASVDYLIPKGTVIQTDGVDPVRFKTTEKATITAGTSSVSDVAIQAVSPGVRGNVGANTLTVMPDPPSGIEEATNPAQTDGGADEENDENLRNRAKDELSDGMRGTAKAIRNRLLQTPTVKSVTLFINDGDATDADGLKSHHVEAVVEGGTDLDVGQTIFETKGAGDGTQGGVHGTAVTVDADLGNGQTHPVDFSRPTEVQIYIDMDLSVSEEYGGDTKVRDAIVRYIGGLHTAGGTDDGELRVSDDVIYTRVLAAIHSVNGVEDVPRLNVGTAASPTGTSNVAISTTEVATADATDGSITITEV
jgi:uncharacterized phage protein gp47/JayE